MRFAVLLTRRVLTAAATLLVVTALVFSLAVWAPGDAAETAAPDERMTAAQREEIRRIYHLDRPPAERYFVWLADVARGDLGLSFRDRRPVATKVIEAAGPTLLLNGLALVAIAFLAVPIGVVSAWRPSSWIDRAALGGTIALHATPVFWGALVLQGVFAARLGWLPLFGLGSAGVRDAALLERIFDVAKHLVLPVACLTYGGLASLSRFVRANLIEANSSEAARGARARGRSAWSVLWVHGFRQAAIPMLTLAGSLLPRLLGGSILVETIFGIRGIGSLFVESALARDLPVVLGVTLLTGAATQAGILAADVAYLAADPRMRHAP